MTEFEQAAGSESIIVASSAFLSVAEELRPFIAAEVGAGRFGELAAAEITLIDAQVAYVDLLLAAAAHHDVEAWNSSIDAYEAADSQILLFENQLAQSCAYWQELD